MSSRSRRVLKPKTSNIPVPGRSRSREPNVVSKQASGRPSSPKVPNKQKRSNSDRLSKVSLASGKFTTPNRFSNVGNKLQVPGSCQSLSRCSGVSAASLRSSIGPKKEPVEKKYKYKYMKNIKSYLVKFDVNHFDRPWNDVLLKPRGNSDFKRLFKAIYSAIDPAFLFGPQFEKQIPEILKKHKYPYVLPKSSFINVTTPHTWISILGMLNFFTNVARLIQKDSLDCYYDYDDFSAEEPKEKVMLECLIEHYFSNTNDEAEEAVNKYARYRLNNNTQKKEEEALKQLEDLQSELEALPEVESQLQMMDQQSAQMDIDLRKLEEYNGILYNHLSGKEECIATLNAELEENNQEEEVIGKRINMLKELKLEQNLTSHDINQIKLEHLEIENDLSHFISEANKIKSEISTQQMELSKIKTSSARCISDFSERCRRNELEIELPDPSLLEQSYQYWMDEILPYLKDREQEAAVLICDKEINDNKERLRLQQFEQVVTDLDVSVKSLEKKIKKGKEEIEFAQENYNQERQYLEEQIDCFIKDCSNIQNRIKESNSSLFLNKKELDILNKEYSSILAKEKEEKKKWDHKLSGAKQQFRILMDNCKRQNLEHALGKKQLELNFKKEMLDLMKKNSLLIMFCR